MRLLGQFLSAAPTLLFIAAFGPLPWGMFTALVIVQATTMIGGMVLESSFRNEEK